MKICVLSDLLNWSQDSLKKNINHKGTQLLGRELLLGHTHKKLIYFIFIIIVFVSLHVILFLKINHFQSHSNSELVSKVSLA